VSAPKPVTTLLHGLQRVLWHAQAEDRISTPQRRPIGTLVAFAQPPSDVLAHDPKAWAIVGGTKDHKRLGSSAQIIRSDGAWIHFTVSVDADAQPIAYDFELVFEQLQTARAARFVRIDLNPPGHKNDAERDRRCHLHPGHDDVQVRWAQRPPVEILQLFVNDLRFVKER